MLAWLELTTGLPVRRSSSATASSERQAVHEHSSASASGRQTLEANADHFLGVVVVDALVPAGGGARLALDVEDLEAERLEIGAELLVVPVRVGRGDRDPARAEGAQGLDHRGAGGDRRARRPPAG